MGYISRVLTWSNPWGAHLSDAWGSHLHLTPETLHEVPAWSNHLESIPATAPNRIPGVVA